MQIGDKISLICLVVLLIYACGALQDGSALVFVLLAHSKIDTVLCV